MSTKYPLANGTTAHYGDIRCADPVAIDIYRVPEGETVVEMAGDQTECWAAAPEYGVLTIKWGGSDISRTGNVRRGRVTASARPDSMVTTTVVFHHCGPVAESGE